MHALAVLLRDFTRFYTRLRVCPRMHTGTRTGVEIKRRLRKRLN